MESNFFLMNRFFLLIIFVVEFRCYYSIMFLNNEDFNEF